MSTINNRQCPSFLINPLGYLMFFQWNSMEFQWDPLDVPNQIQSNPMKIQWKSNEHLMKTNGIQWNSMEFPMRSKVVVYFGGKSRKYLLRLRYFWPSGGRLLIRTWHYLQNETQEAMRRRRDANSSTESPTPSSSVPGAGATSLEKATRTGKFLRDFLWGKNISNIFHRKKKW